MQPQSHEIQNYRTLLRDGRTNTQTDKQIMSFRSLVGIEMCLHYFQF